VQEPQEAPEAPEAPEAQQAQVVSAVPDARPEEEKAREKAASAHDAHVEEFTRRTGMSPQTCYRVVILSLMLRLMGGCWLGMVTIEYARYYVINDLGLFDVIRTATGSPQYALQAFLFPFWGVVADRVSRKKVLVAASLSLSASAWLLTLVPSVEVFIITKVLALVADVGGPIRDAMLRDLFTDEQWESSNGGVTGLKARMFLIGQVAFGVATATGMGLLKLGEWGYGLPNEYTVHKDECGERYCISPGQYSWDGPWQVDGCLRLLMIMGSIIMSLDTFVVIFLFPETIRPECRATRNIWAFMKSSWRELGQPWNNLRVLATEQLRSLMFIRFLGYVVGAGGGSIFLSFYNRFEFDTFTMTLHSVIAGAATWFTTAAVTQIVERYGDLRGIWLPANFLLLCYGFCCAMLPAGHGYMVYAIWPLFAGPSFALGGMAPELLAKLIPSDLQGTFQTGKSFIFRLTMAVFMWPWNQIFVNTRDLAYPLDALPVWISVGLGCVTLVLTVRLLKRDPFQAIKQGKALDAFWETEYANSIWYQRHSAVAVARAEAGENPKVIGNPSAELPETESNPNPEEISVTEVRCEV